MNKVVVFTALFIQASSSLLRQAPGKLFQSAVRHHVKVFGKSTWEFTTYLLPGSFTSKLAKEEGVLELTAASLGGREVLRDFKLPPH